MSGHVWELVVVDDGSPDGTAEVANRLSAQHPVWVVRRAGKAGLASAVIAGFKEARGDILVVMDADLSHPPETVPALLAAIDGAVGGLEATQAKRVRMLGGSLRLVAGREPGGWGTTDEVLDMARAGITARTALAVEVFTGAVRPVLAPEVAALVLVQLAVNAERHDAAETVRLEVDRTTFRVVWRRTGEPVSIRTARRRADRERWGLGFARNAADAIGGSVYPPRAFGDGSVAATLELRGRPERTVAWEPVSRTSASGSVPSGAS